MTNIISIIEKNRPLLSKSSLRTYNSIILNLAKKCDIKIEDANDINKNIDCILNHLKDIPPRLRKTTISALVVVCDDKGDSHSKLLERLRTMMSSDSKIAKSEEDSQTKSQTEKDNWIEWTDVLDKYNKLKKDAEMYMKDETLYTNPVSGAGSPRDKHKFNVIKMYILLSMFILINPRRSLDMVHFKIRNIDKSTDNYMDAKDNKLIFNSYKTMKTYGQQVVDLPKELKKIITKWMTINKTDYLIPDSTDGISSSNKITNLFYKFFGKKVSVNMLRHSKITNLYKDIPALVDMKKTASDMGHSLGEALLYVKK
jgi:integrase